MNRGSPELSATAAGGDIFDVFLSHRYSSPETNLYFYGTISSVMPVTFRVDRGITSTSTTRLERMIRDADAFVGVFPVPGDPLAVHDRASLLKISRYFRLELDMAIRSRKPTIVFCDRRYGNIFRMPADIISYQYDAQDIGRPVRTPARLRLQHAAETFFGYLAASVRAEAAQRAEGHERDLIGVLLPADRGRPDLADAVRGLLSEKGLEPLSLDWPPCLDSGYISKLRRCDWVVLDTSTPAGQAMLAFLHGQFIPTLRVRRTDNPDDADVKPSAAEDVLFGALEVGYRKDVVSWRTADELLSELATRIDVIRLEPELIGDSFRAESYFASAAKRKELVFLSYSGEDAAHGAEFGDELRKHFQEVFDYKASRALRAGEPWVDQIFDNLSAAAIGVLLISESYKTSEHCMTEARELFDAYLAKKLVLLPVKLDDASPPPFLTSLQYERRRQQSPAEIVGDLVARLASTIQGRGEVSY